MMAFVGDAPTTTSDAAKVMFTGFVNRSDAELIGDIGLGIYNQEGKLVKVTPYGQDGRKIFSKSDLSSTMVSGFLEV